MIDQTNGILEAQTKKPPRTDPRRIPKPRFPFLIGKRGMTDGKAIAGPWPDILQILQSIIKQGTDTAEKVSRLLKNTAFLESSLDELLARPQTEEAREPPAEAGREEADIPSFLTNLIPALDELERVRRTVMESGLEEWKRGMRISWDKITALLDAHDFRMSARVGMEFNPLHHEAVGTETNPHLPAGSVSSVIENGWLYRDSVLRYAKVMVAVEAAQAETTAEQKG